MSRDIPHWTLPSTWRSCVYSYRTWFPQNSPFDEWISLRRQLELASTTGIWESVSDEEASSKHELVKISQIVLHCFNTMYKIHNIGHRFVLTVRNCIWVQDQKFCSQLSYVGAQASPITWQCFQPLILSILHERAPVPQQAHSKPTHDSSLQVAITDHKGLAVAFFATNQPRIRSLRFP